ncbi:MAG: citB6 [Herminiimonas sp.]|nr:citB6 [Herminiimonas sp.]
MSQEYATASIKVVIVEDDAVTRRVLSAAIVSEPALDLVAVFDSVAPALEWLATGQVDLLLTDLGLPDGSGLDVIRFCVQRYPACGIMVITMSSDEDNVLACIEAGASGYILKDAGRLDIVRALLDLHAGGSPISPLIARKVLGRMRERKKKARVSLTRDAAGVLTKREAMILDLIARGDSYGEVAKALCVSVGTVQTHVKNIYGKLSVHSRGAAVYEAQRLGLLQMDSLKARE